MIRPHLYFFLFISYKSTWLINYCLIIILVNEKLIIIHSFRYMQKKIKKKHNLKDFQRLYCPWAEISVADFFLEYWSGSGTNMEKMLCPSENYRTRSRNEKTGLRIRIPPSRKTISGSDPRKTTQIRSNPIRFAFIFNFFL